MKKCIDSFCKRYVKKYNKTVKKDYDAFKKIQNKKLDPERMEEFYRHMDAMYKKSLTKKYQKKNDPLVLKSCAEWFCNPGCKDTIFEKKLSKKFTKNLNSSRKIWEDVHKDIFRKKENVLVDGFYEKIKPKLVEALKNKGATSACVRVYRK